MEDSVYRGRSATASDESNPYWISFADIMAGLLIIFILALVTVIFQLRERQQRVTDAILEVKRINEVRKNILTDIEDELKKQFGIEVIISEDNTVLTIPEKELSFETLSYDIPAHQKSNVATIGQVLYKYINKDRRDRDIDTIFIEGHTDSRRADQFKLLGNWGLSTARAISVWQYWSEELPMNKEFNSKDFKNLTNRRGERMISVSGYADTRRRERDDTNDEEKQSRNRRIDVRLSMRTPLLSDYESIRETIVR